MKLISEFTPYQLNYESSIGNQSSYWFVQGPNVSFTNPGLTKSQLQGIAGMLNGAYQLGMADARNIQFNKESENVQPG
jgi:hypothetical protein